MPEQKEIKKKVLQATWDNSDDNEHKEGDSGVKIANVFHSN